MRPDARRGRGRRRTVSWSQGDDHREEEEREDPTVWKAITEQLQRLVNTYYTSSIFYNGAVVSAFIISNKSYCTYKAAA